MLNNKLIFNYEYFCNLSLEKKNNFFSNFHFYDLLKNKNLKRNILNFINKIFEKKKVVINKQMQSYSLKEATIIKLNKYSLMFNLCLNIVDIKED